MNRNVLKKRLSMDGHTIATSVNGQEAVDKVREDRTFDCILMVRDLWIACCDLYTNKII